MAAGPTPLRRSQRTARGLTALEAVLLFVIVAAVLMLAAGQVERTRTRLRTELAVRQLGLLREALVVYYLEQGAFPPGEADQAAAGAWRTLRASPAAARVLSSWPVGAADVPLNKEPVDPWRQPYRYLSMTNDRSGRAADNGTWPVFISSGADRSFGGATEPAGEVDNLASDGPDS